MAKHSNPATSKSAAHPIQLEITRTFDAPKALVFKAWTEAERLAKWSCPKGFTITFGEMDLRVGGSWRVGMRDPGGVVHIARGEYLEIVPTDRLVMTHSWEGGDGPVTTVTVQLSESRGKTTMTFTQTGFDSVASRDGHDGGWSEAMAILGDHLGQSTTVVERPSDRELVFTRLFDAPKTRVFDAFADDSKVVRWWGPNGFRVTTHERQFRPGGVWVHTLHGPDGTDYANKSVFQEIVPNARIVYSNGGGREGGPGVSFVATITFEELPGATGRVQTRVRTSMTFPTAQDLETVIREYGADEGGRQHMARLAEFVCGPASDESEFVLTRTFDAPVERVWRAWTNEEQLAAWFGPKGCPITQCTLDLRPGGRSHYCLRLQDGSDLWGRWVFTSIDPPPAEPATLRFISSFSSPQGDITTHPMAPTWPREMETVVTFARQGAKTVMTLRWWPINASTIQRQTFEDGRASMFGGWSGTAEQLVAYLARDR